MKSKFSKWNTISTIAMICLLIVLLAISPYLPDSGPGIIKKELTKQGYHVENIDFTYVSKGSAYRELIYRSSEPIEYSGQSVSEWSVRSSSSAGCSSISYYSVSPN